MLPLPQPGSCCVPRPPPGSPPSLLQPEVGTTAANLRITLSSETGMLPLCPCKKPQELPSVVVSEPRPCKGASDWWVSESRACTLAAKYAGKCSFVCFCIKILCFECRIHNVGNFQNLKVFIVFCAATCNSCPQVHGKCELLFSSNPSHQFCAHEEMIKPSYERTEGKICL